MSPSGSPTTGEFAPGEVLFDYCEVRALVGEGGMGRVYEVFHRSWDMHLCAKVPRPEVMADAIASTNFERECQTWVDLGLHPHIVTCYFIRRLGELPLIFAEYVSGGSLHDWIRDGRLYAGGPQIALARIIDFAIQFAWGLHFAHARGIVHQDVKPANVMIATDETVKVTDFGLARAGRRQRNRGPDASAPVISSGMTPAYASPEQINDQPLDRRSDLWSWAISVLEMFVGSRTWRVGTAGPAVLDEYCKEVGKAERADRPAMPGEIEALLRKCLARDADERPDDMARVANTLMDIYFMSTGSAYERPMPAFAHEYGDGLHVGSLNNRAISMLELNHTEKAIELFVEAELTARTSVNRETLAALQEIAYNRTLLQIRTNPAFSTGSIPALVPVEPDRIKHALYTGMLLLEAGNPIQAADVLLEVVSTSRRFLIDALNIRGICLLLGGESKPAILSFRAAVQQAPDHADGYRNLAIAYYFDRQYFRGLRTYLRYAGMRRLDVEDSTALATMYAAVGARAQARTHLAAVTGATHRPASALLSAAELAEGIQTFLPGVCPVPGVEYPRALVGEALASAPDNLRAHVDQAMRSRDGAQFGQSVKKNVRTWPEPRDPQQTARGVFTSYQPMTGAGRWGVLSSSPQLHRVMALSAAAALLMAVVLWPRLLSDEAIQNGFGTSSTGFVRAFWIGMSAALVLITTRRVSPSQLWTDVLFGCASVLGMLYVPSIAHHAFANGLSDAGVQAVYPEHRQLFLRVFLCLAAVISTREVIFRFFSSRYRAFGSWRLGCPDGALNQGTIAPARDDGDAAGAIDANHASIPVYSLIYAWAVSAWTRTSPGLTRSLRRVLANCGVWQFFLIPEFVTLSILDTLWLQWATYAQIAVYFVLMLSVNGLLLAYAAVVPRLFITANTVLCLLLGARISTLAFPGSAGYAVACFVLVSAPLLFANWKSYRCCPAFAPLWTSIPDRQWDFMSMVDPLNVRRFATPWRIVRMANLEPESVNAPSANGLSGFKL